MNLTKEQIREFDEILEELGRTLDISQTEYEAAVRSYNAVGKQLSKKGSLLEKYKPEILPQGSFLIGTMIKPVNESDDLDIDLVCKLENKTGDETQSDLKKLVGDQIKENAVYAKILETPDGRRCWTMRYRENAQDEGKKYHMDILPAFVDSGYKLILERAFSNLNYAKTDTLAIRITDKEHPGYKSDKNHLNWLKSNPFGYAIWFESKAVAASSLRLLSENSIQAVPMYKKEKLALQRIVQILKRHRDMMFSTEEQKEDKPISIIITTLAARAYRGEKGIIEGLINVVNNMSEYIEERNDPATGRKIKWIVNPVNEEENFADKWVSFPLRERNFYAWLEQIKKDLHKTTQLRGLALIQEAMSTSYGSDIVQRAFSNYGANKLKARENNKLRMAAGTGTIGSEGRTPIIQHQNYGVHE